MELCLSPSSAPSLLWESLAEQVQWMERFSVVSVPWPIQDGSFFSTMAAWLCFVLIQGYRAQREVWVSFVFTWSRGAETLQWGHEATATLLAASHAFCCSEITVWLGLLQPSPGTAIPAVFQSPSLPSARRGQSAWGSLCRLCSVLLAINFCPGTAAHDKVLCILFVTAHVYL